MKLSEYIIQLGDLLNQGDIEVYSYDWNTGVSPAQPPRLAAVRKARKREINRYLHSKFDKEDIDFPVVIV